ncbi:MAG TPA: hypothetical protein VL137_08125, partial [Polyangiaceae bacterium]|nr:hypothetical protein [Polyangiaceae bacterium]
MNFHPRILTHSALLGALALASSACSSNDYFPYGLGSDGMTIPNRDQAGSKGSTPNADLLASDTATGGASGSSDSTHNTPPALNSAAGATAALDDETTPADATRPASLRVSLTDA